MLEPKEIEIETAHDGVKKYVLHKFDCIEGRRILTQYPLTGAPKIGDYGENEKLMTTVLAYVAIRLNDGTTQKLTTRLLITNHVPDTDTLLKLEYEMFKYNFSFFREGDVFEVLKVFLAQIKPAVTQTLMDSSESSSRADKRHSMN